MAAPEGGLRCWVYACQLTGGIHGFDKEAAPSAIRSGRGAKGGRESSDPPLDIESESFQQVGSRSARTHFFQRNLRMVMNKLRDIPQHIRIRVDCVERTLTLDSTCHRDFLRV